MNRGGRGAAAWVDSGGVGGDRGYCRVLELREDEGDLTEAEWRHRDGPNGALNGEVELAIVAFMAAERGGGV